MLKHRGYTLIEMMVALIIAMIMAFAAITLMANSFRSNTRTIQLVQLTQELRSSMQLMIRDIRRAGYTADVIANYQATQAIASGLTMGPLSGGSASCLRIQYVDENNNAQNAVYRRLIRGTVGVVAAHFGATSTCATSTTEDGWVDITDPTLNDITSLTFTPNTQTLDMFTNPDTGNTIQLGLQQVEISITGQSLADTTVNRTIRDEVRLRNEYMTV